MTVIQFLRWYPPYNGGETASLDDVTAAALITAGIAASTEITPTSPTSNAGGVLVDAADDAAAATAGVAIDSVYRNGSILMERIA